MAGLIELMMMMMRQTETVEGEQDVQYIDSLAKPAGVDIVSWALGLESFFVHSDALSRAHTASSFEDSIDYRTKLPRQRANSLKDEVAMPHYAAQGPIHQAVKAITDWARSWSSSSCHRAWPLRITA